MEWRDHGFVIATRKRGEGGVIVEVLTENHGRWLGFIYGGQTRKRRNTIGVLGLEGLQRGNLLSLLWRARLESHLGVFRGELERSLSAHFFDDAFALDGLNALCALIRVLPERQAHPHIFLRFATLIELLAQSDNIWPLHFARFELALLTDLGFGLALDEKQALPSFLFQEGADPDFDEVALALSQTARLLYERVYQPYGHRLPKARLALSRHFENKSS